jgi:hypothetical protein
MQSTTLEVTEDDVFAAATRTWLAGGFSQPIRVFSPQLEG